jgi:hypothetical protein
VLQHGPRCAVGQREIGQVKHRRGGRNHTRPIFEADRGGRTGEQRVPHFLFADYEFSTKIASFTLEFRRINRVLTGS